MTTLELLKTVKSCAGRVAVASTQEKNQALSAMAQALLDNMDTILAANAQDMEAAKGTISEVMLDRLCLTPQRIEAMAAGIRHVVTLPDPVGRVRSSVKKENGMVIDRVGVPMGVVAIIYESRPNVTSDAAALALKSGNACVLRSGKEAFRSANAIVQAMQQGLKSSSIPATKSPRLLRVGQSWGFFVWFHLLVIIILHRPNLHRPNPHLRIHRETHDLLPFLNTTYTLQTPQLWVC